MTKNLWMVYDGEREMLGDMRLTPRGSHSVVGTANTIEKWLTANSGGFYPSILPLSLGSWYDFLIGSQDGSAQHATKALPSEQSYEETSRAPCEDAARSLGRIPSVAPPEVTWRTPVATIPGEVSGSQDGHGRRSAEELPAGRNSVLRPRIPSDCNRTPTKSWTAQVLHEDFPHPTPTSWSPNSWDAGVKMATPGLRNPRPRWRIPICWSFLGTWNCQD